MIPKSITITKEQNKYVNDNSINLSRLIQKVLQKKIERDN